ncbi:MAG: PKD domain-containing protein, partial [Thermoplasmata archaeon]|nr:PKD domain-containing protein [Thermoplasmata archaeon]NIT77081.1 PKD domain-containing protein [Thermoplasmata archaeon]NIU48993.1 PKD domain-containing protein [Thermoplasmata archaeon]NIW82483.1 PKD domain-containing protein [Thermoplasmata archaeon]NIY03452.1 PKD domain-containing protein [Thermoplasmata archaeon]
MNQTGRTPKYTFPTPGVYNVTLTVYDSDGQFDTDSMTVTVVDVTPPIADAGQVREFNEDVEVTMDASLSFDDVGIVSYRWVVTYQGVTVFEGNKKKERFNFTDPGLYEVTLTVTDGVGLTAEDTVQYSVIDVTPPTASVGIDVELDEDAPHTFSGSASQDNVGIVDWEWVISAEDMPPVRRTGESFEYVFSEPGVYTVT